MNHTLAFGPNENIIEHRRLATHTLAMEVAKRVRKAFYICREEFAERKSFNHLDCLEIRAYNDNLNHEATIVVTWNVTTLEVNVLSEYEEVEN